MDSESKLTRRREGGSRYEYRFEQVWPDGQRNTITFVSSEDHGDGLHPAQETARSMMNDAFNLAKLDPLTWERFQSFVIEFAHDVRSERVNKTLRKLWRAKGILEGHPHTS